MSPYRELAFPAKKEGETVPIVVREVCRRSASSVGVGVDESRLHLARELLGSIMLRLRAMLCQRATAVQRNFSYPIRYHHRLELAVLPAQAIVVAYNPRLRVPQHPTAA
jgi:hypothetical protein